MNSLSTGLTERWLKPISSVALVLSAVIVGVQAWDLLKGGSIGIDFSPLRHAGQDVIAGRSVYTDPTFVYPPPAAFVLAPLALGTTTAMYRCWVLVSLMALVLAALVIARSGEPRTLRLSSAGAILALAGGCVASDCLNLGNLSALLVPVAVCVLVQFDRGHWRTGCAILALSLLVKPLLVPLLLVPALRRRWLDLAVTMGPAGLGLAAAVAFLPGGEHFWYIVRYDLTGTNLHGALAQNNLSLRGWAAAHGTSVAAGTAAAVTVGVVAAVAVILQSRAGMTGVTSAEVGGLAMLTVLLAGDTSEVTYLFIPLAIALLELISGPSLRRKVLLLPGALMLALPLSYVQYLSGRPAAYQTWYVAAEVALFTGTVACLPVFARPDTRPARRRRPVSGTSSVTAARVSG